MKRSRPLPPGKGSPRRVLEVDRQEESPFFAGRLTVCRCARLAESSILLVDRLLGDRRLAPADLDAAVGAELAVGRTPTSNEKMQRLALAGHVAEVDLRVADRRDARLVDRLHVPAGELAVNGLLEDRIAPRGAG